MDSQFLHQRRWRLATSRLGFALVTLVVALLLEDYDHHGTISWAGLLDVQNTAPLVWLLEAVLFGWVVAGFFSSHPIAEAQARYMGERLQSAIETLDDGFVIYDKNDRLVICNERYREIYSASAPAIVPGNTFVNILRYGIDHGQYVDAIGREEEWLAKRLLQHRRSDLNVEQQLEDGRWLRIAERETPNGEWVGFRVDISEQKAVQEELQKAKDKAEAASEAKSRFLSQMNHELRSPLNSIVGFAQALNDPAQRVNEDEELRYAGNILDAASHLEMVINDILDLSKIEQGKLVLEELDFDLSSLVYRALDMYEVRAKDKGLDFVLDMNTSSVWLKGDPVRIRQVLFNLIDNAIKFTSSGQVILQVDVLDLERSPVAVKFAVKDTGIGIHTEHIQNIFAPFSQADASINRRFGGTGLGLTISSELVQAMGGELLVKSEENKGSEFSFTVELPLGRPKSVSSDEASLPSMNVLVVDDIASNLTVARLLLEAEGHTVVGVDSAEKALEKMHEAAFDLLLVDLHMPVMNGIELTAAIRALDDPEKAKVMLMILSADTQSEQKEAAKAAGADAYLPKPFNVIGLRNNLITLMTRRALGR